MGPQLYRCGNREYADNERLERDVLQWGRNFIVAEIDGTIASHVRNTVSFNGAATLSLRKYTACHQTILYDL